MNHTPRITVRKLMLIVAFAGVVMSLVVYRERLKARVAYHSRQVAESSVRIPASPFPAPGTLVIKDPESGGMSSYRMTPEARWHENLANQYSRSVANIGLFIAIVMLVSLGLLVVNFLAGTIRRRRHRGSESNSPPT
jgi:hypothetical protein